jgi:hypothetical protein
LHPDVEEAVHASKHDMLLVIALLQSGCWIEHGEQTSAVVDMPESAH